MRDKLILTDADDVLLAWSESFNKWCKTEHKLDRLRSDSYCLGHCYGIDPKEAGKLARQFNESDQIKKLSPFRDSKHGIKKLTDAGYKFGVVTSLGTHEDSIANREENLHALFGSHAFEFIECLELAGPKHDFLKQFEGSNMFWVEDKWENAVAGKDLGLDPIIISTPYNQHKFDMKITRVDTWLQICNKILT